MKAEEAWAGSDIENIYAGVLHMLLVLEDSHRACSEVIQGQCRFYILRSIQKQFSILEIRKLSYCSL